MALTINSAQYNSNAEYETVTGEIVSISNAKPYVRMKQVVCDINPVQDLHGYDHPWPAGGGKNLVNVSDVANITTQTVVMNDTSLSAGTYTISVYISNSGTAGAAIRIFVDGTAVKTSDYVTSSTKTRVSATVTLSQTSIVKVAVVGSASGYNASLTDFQLEAGSTATAYAPYSNICPISGWSSAKVTRAGKNLYDPSTKTETSNNTYNILDVKANTDYVFSVDTQQAGLYVQYLNGGSWTTLIFKYDATWIAFNTGVHTQIRLMTFKTNSQQTPTEFQLELGSTATDYEPYNGQTFTIDLDGTRYGGTLDVTRGKLKVTHAYKVLNGTETWYAITSPANGFRNSGSTDFPGRKSGGEFICNRLYDKGNSLSDLTNTWDAVWATNLNIRTDNLFADADAFKAWLADNPLQCVYELATPLEYDLTAQEIKTLLGTNNVWADTGEMEVTYMVAN